MPEYPFLPLPRVERGEPPTVPGFVPSAPSVSTERRDNISRLLGHGFPNLEESLACAPNRATLVGYGTIEARESNVHRIPLPPSLEQMTEPRALTVTVAWFSPVNPKHHAYRRPKLDAAVSRPASRSSIRPEWCPRPWDLVSTSTGARCSTALFTAQTQTQDRAPRTGPQHPRSAARPAPPPDEPTSSPGRSHLQSPP